MKVIGVGLAVCVAQGMIIVVLDTVFTFKLRENLSSLQCHLKHEHPAPISSFKYFFVYVTVLEQDLNFFIRSLHDP